jgi:N-acetylmuramoyl-L-alanine amidase
MGEADELKRRMVRGAVEENLDVMSGLPPRPLRPARRVLALWGPRSLPAAAAAVLAVTLQAVAFDEAPPLPPPVAPATMLSAHRPLRPADPPRFVDGRYSRPVPISAKVLALGVRRVVIDPGHGGGNTGTSAAGGLLEKDLTLDIAGRLGALLAASRVEAVMTRTGDRAVSLQRRAELASEAGGDLFVSIHLNALGDRRTRGIETYYLGPTTDPALAALAARENRESGYSLADLRRLLDGVFADVRREESKALATAVQRSLLAAVRRVSPEMPDRGVKTAPFVVLVATDMPAILAEVSCLSNDEEAGLLQTIEYRQALADALFAGIQAYAGREARIARKGEAHGS